MDSSLHSEKGLILMHLRMLQMATESLNEQMLSRRTQGTFAEGRASYVQNLLWFAALSVSELKANMVDFIRRRHTVESYAASTAPSRSGGESVYGLDAKAAVEASMAAESPPRGLSAPRPTPSQKRSPGIRLGDAKQPFDLDSDPKSAPIYPNGDYENKKQRRSERKPRQAKKKNLRSFSLSSGVTSFFLRSLHQSSKKGKPYRRRRRSGTPPNDRLDSNLHAFKEDAIDTIDKENANEDSVRQESEFVSAHGRKSRSAASFDSSVMPLGTETWNSRYEHEPPRSGRTRNDHRRMSMGGGGGQNEMGSFQVKFLLRFKQVRNQDKSGVQRQELVGLVQKHCTWIINSVELPFRKMIDRFVLDMRAGGSVRCMRDDPWGKSAKPAHAGNGYDGADEIKKRSLREQLLQISEFVSTLALTIWRMHETLQSRRDPGPMRDLFLPVCKKTIWPVVLRDLEHIIFERYRDVYKQTSLELHSNWSKLRSEVEGKGRNDPEGEVVYRKFRLIADRLVPLSLILGGNKFGGDRLQGKTEALLTLIRTVPLVVPSESTASADNLLSMISFCLIHTNIPDACAHVHFVSDMVMLVHSDDALGELGCSVTSLTCAAQYSAGLETDDYVELIESLAEEIGIDSNDCKKYQKSAPRTTRDAGGGADDDEDDEDDEEEDKKSSVSEPGRDARAWSKSLTASITVQGVESPMGSISGGTATPESTSQKGKRASLDGMGAGEHGEKKRNVKTEARLRYWQGDISDLISICQHAAKHVGFRATLLSPTVSSGQPDPTKSSSEKIQPHTRRVFSAGELVSHFYRSQICDSTADAIYLGRTLEAHGVIRPHLEKNRKVWNSPPEKSPPLPPKGANSNESGKGRKGIGIRWGSRSSIFKKRSGDLDKKGAVKTSIKERKLVFDNNHDHWEVAGRFGDAGQKFGGAFQSSVQTLASMWKTRKENEKGTMKRI